MNGKGKLELLEQFSSTVETIHYDCLQRRVRLPDGAESIEEQRRFLKATGIPPHEIFWAQFKAMNKATVRYLKESLRTPSREKL